MRKSREESAAIRAAAKEAGIEGWDTKKLGAVEKLLANHSEGSPEPEVEVVEPELEVNYDAMIDPYQLKMLENTGFHIEWLKPLAVQYGFDKFQYLHKCRAFRCYREGKHLDWIEVNDLSNMNGLQDLIHSPYKKPQLPQKPVIKLKWR